MWASWKFCMYLVQILYRAYLQQTAGSMIHYFGNFYRVHFPLFFTILLLFFPPFLSLLHFFFFGPNTNILRGALSVAADTAPLTLKSAVTPKVWTCLSFDVSLSSRQKWGPIESFFGNIETIDDYFILDIGYGLKVVSQRGGGCPFSSLLTI